MQLSSTHQQDNKYQDYDAAFHDDSCGMGRGSLLADRQTIFVSQQSNRAGSKW
jgi:hypothetical protein